MPARGFAAGFSVCAALTHHCHIVETGNESWRFRNSSARLAPGRAVKTRKTQTNKTEETEDLPTNP
jgi:hypothetical protein